MAFYQFPGSLGWGFPPLINITSGCDREASISDAWGFYKSDGCAASKLQRRSESVQDTGNILLTPMGDKPQRDIMDLRLRGGGGVTMQVSA